MLYSKTKQNISVNTGTYTVSYSTLYDKAKHFGPHLTYTISCTIQLDKSNISALTGTYTVLYSTLLDNANYFGQLLTNTG